MVQHNLNLSLNEITHLPVAVFVGDGENLQVSIDCMLKFCFFFSHYTIPLSSFHAMLEAVMAP